MIYVVSDIHGCYHTFQKLLNQISFSKNDTMICLGDTIDRGNYNLAMLNLFMDNDNMILIKGNHEYFYECWIKGWLAERQWWGFGGKPTILELKNLSEKEIMKYYEFIRTLPLYYETDEYIMAHNGFKAGFPFVRNNDGVILIKDTIETQWKVNSYDFIISSDIHRHLPNLKLDKRLIVGHYPTPFLGSPNILHNKNCIAIDGGATYQNGRLSCLRLDDLAEFYENIDDKDIA